MNRAFRPPQVFFPSPLEIEYRPQRTVIAETVYATGILYLVVASHSTTLYAIVMMYSVLKTHFKTVFNFFINSPYCLPVAVTEILDAFTRFPEPLYVSIVSSPAD